MQFIGFFFFKIIQTSYLISQKYRNTFTRVLYKTEYCSCCYMRRNNYFQLIATSPIRLHANNIVHYANAVISSGLARAGRGEGREKKNKKYDIVKMSSAQIICKTISAVQLFGSTLRWIER